MPVKIRLTRIGKKKQPTYRVVVVASRKPRDGAHIEQIGRYDPRQEPSIVEVDNERALKWLLDGAQPTDRVRKILEISGAWARFRMARGEIHTVGDATPSDSSDSKPETDAEDFVAENLDSVVEEELTTEDDGTAATAEEGSAETAVEEDAVVAESAAGEKETE